MTEDEWLTSTNIEHLVRELAKQAPTRKLRLFACACAERLTGLSPEIRTVIEAAVLYADRRLTSEQLAQIAEKMTLSGNTGFMLGVISEGLSLLLPPILARELWPYHGGQTADLHSLRDIFGNPFRRLGFAPAWRTGNVVALARSMYFGNQFDDLPILADALMDAGCEDETILAHCHTTHHVRGCWLLDEIMNCGWYAV